MVLGCLCDVSSVSHPKRCVFTSDDDLCVVFFTSGEVCFYVIVTMPVSTYMFDVVDCVYALMIPPMNDE